MLFVLAVFWYSVRLMLFVLVDRCCWNKSQNDPSWGRDTTGLLKCLKWTWWRLSASPMVYSPCFTVRSTSQTIVCYPCCDVYGLYTQMLPSYGQNLDKDSSHGSTQFDPCPPKKSMLESLLANSGLFLFCWRIACLWEKPRKTSCVGGCDPSSHTI